MSNEKVAPLMTFTGPAGRTRWDENGALKTVGEDEIVEEYDPRTGRYRGTRYEQNDSNTVEYSEALENAVVYSATTVSANAGIAPDGNNTARRLTANPVSDARGRLHSGSYGVSDGPTRINYCFFKKDSEHSTVAVGVYVSSTRFAWVSVNLDTFVADAVNYGGIGGVSLESVTPLLNGWFRIDVKHSFSADFIYRPMINFGTGSAYDLYQGNPAQSGSVLAWGLSSTKYGGSYIRTNGFPAARARDDARFTDPAIFNAFERGTFVVEWETQSLDETGFRNYILSRGGNGRILAQHGGEYGNANQKGQMYSYDGSSGLYTQPPPFKRCKAVVSFDSDRRTMCVTGGEPVVGPWNGTFGNGDVIIGEQNWSGWMPRISFLPGALTPQQQKRIVAMPRRTTIASGTILGDYDPNERLSLFQDRHGIKPVERDGDPVRFILDLGPQGNHLQAAPESTGLIYRTDGVRSWIEYNGVNDYFQYRAGPILRGDISVSAHVALQLAVDKPAGSQLRVLIAQGTPVDSSLEFSVGHYQNGPDTCWFSVGQPTESRLELALSNIQRGRWTVFWADIEQGIRSVYQDGLSVGSSANPVSGGYLKGSQFRLGYDNNGRYWKGPMGRVTLTADASQADRDAIDAEIIDRYVSA